MKSKCLIVDDMHPVIIEKLENIGIEVDYRPDIDRESTLSIIHKYHGLIVRSKFKIDRPLLENASKLLFIARAGAGMDQIDVAEAEKRNVQLFNAPEGNRDALAEHTIGLMLALLNNIVPSNNEVKNKIWKREANRGHELGQKVVAIIGCGYMGRAVVNKLSVFGCKVLVYDKTGMVENLPANASNASMEEIYEEADVLSLHIPLDEKSRNLINKEYLSKFKKHIWVINTARGEILPIKDLLELLKNGKILGVGLDVLENEKFNTYLPEQMEDFEALAELPNVILTPHVGGWSFESYVRISDVLVEKIKYSGLF
jgi:D-3-phosphoglycerate dehydrogenase